MLISVAEPRRVFHLNNLIRHYMPHIFLPVGSIQMFLSQALRYLKFIVTLAGFSMLSTCRNVLTSCYILCLANDRSNCTETFTFRILRFWYLFIFLLNLFVCNAVYFAFCLYEQ